MDSSFYTSNARNSQLVTFAGECKRRRGAHRSKVNKKSKKKNKNRQIFTDTCEKWSSVRTMIDYPIYGLQGGQTPFLILSPLSNVVASS